MIKCNKARVVPQSLKPENEAVVVVTALGHAVAGASCFNGVNMLHIEYHQPLAFIKSHQGTNKSVCTLIKQRKKAKKKDNNSLMVCHELESGYSGTYHKINPSLSFTEAAS